ncbi:MAG: AraC family transcriptional regulator [Parahaliea sp.]
MSELIDISALSAYLESCERLHFNPAPLLRECGIDYLMLQRQKGFISFIQLVKVLELTAEAANCPHFGLMMSEKRSLGVLGLLGLLMEKSPDVRSAWQALVQYFYTHTRGAVIELKEEEHSAMLIYRIIACCPTATQCVDLSIGTALATFKLLVGHPIRPQVVYLSHSNTSSSDQYRRILQAPVVFDHELNAIVFDRDLLDKPLQTDQSIERVLKEILEASQHPGSDVVPNVRLLIANLLPVGYCSLDEVARRLLMSPRKLQYLLADKDLTFSVLVDDVRARIAQQYLSQSKIPFSQLCQSLGYSNQTAFTRAFKRWFGQTPKQWKKQHRSH